VGSTEPTTPVLSGGSGTYLVNIERIAEGCGCHVQCSGGSKTNAKAGSSCQNKAISVDMASKLVQRGADAGIYLSQTQDGLSLREIGEWAEGTSDQGPWVACTH
jgi:hypothetical protein